MSDIAQCTEKHQQLLRELKNTIEGLLVGQVANVWCIYGGLNRLHNDVERIFESSCKTKSHSENSNYWQFLQGLEWLQPDALKSTFSVDCEYKLHVPLHMKNNKASIWLYRNLENHSLSQKLSWLISDKSHLLSCYNSNAFLCQQAYAEAMLICLRAVERNQPSLLSEINPSLFLSTMSARDYYRIHRRCSSFPDAHITLYSSTKSKVTNQTSQINTRKSALKTQSKIKAWSSTPNLGIQGIQIRERSKSMAQSRTNPSTPVNFHTDKLDGNIVELNKKVAKKIKQEEKNVKSCQKSRKDVKHILIDNCDIIEHTSLSSSNNSGNDCMNFMVKSLSDMTSHHPKCMSPRSTLEYNFLHNLSGVSGQKDYKKQPKKTFIEDGGMSVLPMSTGFFPRPTKGQSLTEFLTSGQFARANAELDRENAHFSISEAMIAAMEQLRCRRDLNLVEEQTEDSDEEIRTLKQRIRLRRREKLEERQKKIWGLSLLSDGKTDTTTTEPSVSSFSSSPGSFSDSLSSEEVDDMEIDEASNLTDNKGLSMSMASLYSEADVLRKPRGAPDGASDVLSAEGVALSLISRFNDKHLPRASDLEWLVSEKDAPQALLPLPKSWPISPDEISDSTSLRGTREWAPPRPQIIFTLHASPVRKRLISNQNYRCAGCGMRVASQYASRFRYCNYLGRYFCTGCHTNQLALIPGRILHKWDFTRYIVSTFSYRLLEQMYFDPLFRIFELNKHIEKRCKNLQTCRKYRMGLYYLKDFILTCRFADIIQDNLKSEPSYIYTDPEIYSINDLVNVRTGELKSKLKYLVEICCRHTSECELCTARGFICEICNSKEVIFPWQMRIVKRCPSCGNCCHLTCWKSQQLPCVRCQRISKRRESLEATHA